MRHYWWLKGGRVSLSHMKNLSPIQKSFFFLQGENSCLHQCFVLVFLFCLALGFCCCCYCLSVWFFFFLLMTFWWWFYYQKAHGEEESSRCIMCPAWQRVRLVGNLSHNLQVAHLCVPSLLLTLSCTPHYLQDLQPNEFERTLDRQSRHLDFLFSLGNLSPPVTICFIHAKTGFKHHVAATNSATMIPKDISVSQKSPYLALLALGK